VALKKGFLPYGRNPFFNALLNKFCKNTRKEEGCLTIKTMGMCKALTCSLSAFVFVDGVFL